MKERRSSQGRTPLAPHESAEFNQIDKLKKKIIEGNFSEPKSLFKGMDPSMMISLKGVMITLTFLEIFRRKDILKILLTLSEKILLSLIIT